MGLHISVQQRPVSHFIGKPVTARRSEFDHPGGVNEMSNGICGWGGEHRITPLSGSLHVHRRTGNHSDPIDLTVAVPVQLPVKPVQLPAATVDTTTVLVSAAMERST